MSSWIRSAVSKAVVVGGKNNITRTVRNYADTVVHHAGQAVAGGAKILQDRMGVRDHKSIKQTVRRLEEASISCRGSERTELLKRWVQALREVERVSGSSLDEKSVEESHLPDQQGSPRKSSLVLFSEPDMAGEPMNFRDVFLHSQALEGITLSIILEAPNGEELPLLLEIFGYCLTGGKEVHNAVMSSIQDLAKVFAAYKDEVLVKREELLQFAQSAISGLKLNPELTRINVETLKLQQKIDELEDLQFPATNDLLEESNKTTLENVKELKGALEEVRNCSRLEKLLLKKRSMNSGDSSEIHSQKVEKLKVLADSLANSSSKAEKRILDHRNQKEEALNFRVVKEKEVSEIEKELAAEVAGLEKQRDVLEAQLKQVNASLAAANARLSKTKEERDQFDEASNQLVMHLKTKEDELSRSIASCKLESDVVKTWINFLEDTWQLQSSYTEVTEKQTNDELEKCGEIYEKLIRHHLLACKEKLGLSVDRIRTFVGNLHKLKERLEDTIPSSDIESNPQKLVEVEYLETERMIITTFSIVDHMKGLYYAGNDNGPRRDASGVKTLFAEIEKLRAEFESIERPILLIEIPEEKAIPTEERQQTNSNESHTIVESVEKKENIANSPKESPSSSEETLDPDSELARLEQEFGKATRDSKTQDIEGWEFDELEEELRSEFKK